MRTVDDTAKIAWAGGGTADTDERAGIGVVGDEALAHISCQRIGQLLAERTLTGPTYAGTPPRNAPRVWEDNVDAELPRRTRTAAQDGIRRSVCVNGQRQL